MRPNSSCLLYVLTNACIKYALSVITRSYVTSPYGTDEWTDRGRPYLIPPNRVGCIMKPSLSSSFLLIELLSRVVGWLLDLSGRRPNTCCRCCRLIPQLISWHARRVADTLGIRLSIIYLHRYISSRRRSPEWIILRRVTKTFPTWYLISIYSAGVRSGLCVQTFCEIIAHSRAWHNAPPDVVW